MFITQEEQMLGDLLTANQIEYLYEMHAFILDVSHVNGRSIKAFRPDFYLPEIDLYIEVTANSNSKKRSKIRQAVEFYPYLQVFLCEAHTFEEIKTLNKQELFSFFINNYKSTSHLDQPKVLQYDQEARPILHEELQNNIQLQRIPFATFTPTCASLIALMKRARTAKDYDLAHLYERELLRCGFDRDTQGANKSESGAVLAVLHPLLRQKLNKFEEEDRKVINSTVTTKLKA